MKTRKKLVGLFVSLVLILAMPLSTWALDIYVDDMYVDSPYGAVIMNNRTMVPVRAVAELMGCRVEWSQDVQGIYIYDPHTDQDVIDMWIGSYEVTTYVHDSYGDVVDSYSDYLDSPPVLLEGKTYVPLRFIAETLGYVVEYNAEYGYVDLYSYDYY